MDNAEEILQLLEEFSRRKQKSIPPELDDYLAYVARTGDPVFQWIMVKSLFKEKLMNVISDFNETTPGMDIPPYPNVDPFNYETMKESLMERLDSFVAAPFTVQRICELLMYPRKQYNRIDKFMRAIEKNILVVSTREPGVQRLADLENGDPSEAMVNGSESSDYTVDVEMEDVSWNEKRERNHMRDPQPSSSDNSDDIEVRRKPKQDTPRKSRVKLTEFESVTPSRLSALDESPVKPKSSDSEKQVDENEDQKDPASKKKKYKEDIVKTETSDDSEVRSGSFEEASDEDMLEDDRKPAEPLPTEPDEKQEKPSDNQEPVKKTNENDELMEQKEEDMEKDPENKEPEKQPETTESKTTLEIEELSESSSENSSSSDGNVNSPKTDPETIPDSNEELSEAETEAVSTIDANEDTSSAENKAEEIGAGDMQKEDKIEKETKNEIEKEKDNSEVPVIEEEAKSPEHVSVPEEKSPISDLKSEVSAEEIKDEGASGDTAAAEPKAEKIGEAESSDNAV